jgi:hypothetical protein
MFGRRRRGGGNAGRGGGSGVALLGSHRGRAADALATANDGDRCALAGGGAGRGGQRRGVGPLTADASACGGSGVALLGSRLGRASALPSITEGTCIFFIASHIIANSAAVGFSKSTES